MQICIIIKNIFLCLCHRKIKTLKMKKTVLILSVLSLSMASCQRSCEKLSRDYQSSERNYEVIMYSGGDTIFHDKFKGIINNNEHSDGCYYYNNGQLIELSGDYIIKSND